jgi:hypothetical protein
MFHPSGHQGRAVLDLKQMAIVKSNKTISVDEQSLSALLGFSATNPRDAERVATLLRFLQSARDGTLPPPNHHGHELPEPLSGYLQHFASGTSIPPLQLIWMLAWMAFGLSRLLLRNVSQVEGSADGR